MPHYVTNHLDFVLRRLLTPLWVAEWTILQANGPITGFACYSRPVLGVRRRWPGPTSPMSA